MCQPREIWEALEADLLRAGFTLDDYPARLSLRAVRQMLLYAARGSSVHRMVQGVKADWTTTEELLARVLETLWDANWQRQGDQYAPKPKRLPRPGEPLPKGVKHYGDAEGYTIAEYERIWAERSRAA